MQNFSEACLAKVSVRPIAAEKADFRVKFHHSPEQGEISVSNNFLYHVKCEKLDKADRFEGGEVP